MFFLLKHLLRDLVCLHRQLSVHKSKVSDIMRNQLLAYAKTKEQISAFVFATHIVQSLLLKPKFQVSCHPLWLYSQICVGPGWNPTLRPVFLDAAQTYPSSSRDPRLAIVEFLPTSDFLKHHIKHSESKLMKPVSEYKTSQVKHSNILFVWFVALRPW